MENLHSTLKENTTLFLHSIRSSILVLYFNSKALSMGMVFISLTISYMVSLIVIKPTYSWKRNLYYEYPL